MSTLSTANIESKAANTPPVIKDLNGTEVGQFARAWVNFNGTGTVAIRDSFNVSSITDNGTGNYTVTFTNAMSDANYAAFCSNMFDDDSVNNGGGVWANLTRFAQTTTQVRVVSESYTSTLYDVKTVNVVVFGS